ncbi:protein FAM107B-like isoform X2 [Tachypleus tridentatus]|uniref:protein FAM107B-like isoform X2 n=1 Tax=Tachypleus tridentatus TaxID=6853 RepID=UPI003FD6883B
MEVSFSNKTNREVNCQSSSELQRMSNYKKQDMIPEPDYSDTEEDKNKKVCQPLSRSTSNIQYSKDGLILPRKLCNPCLESSERKMLHRELLFNQKIGKNVLNQKTELQKVLEKFKDEQKKKNTEVEKQNNRTALEKKLEQQANKIKEYEDLNEEKPKKDESEFLKVHAKVRAHTLS